MRIAIAAGLLGSLGLTTLGSPALAQVGRGPQRLERSEGHGRGQGRGHYGQGRGHYGQALTTAAAELGVSAADLKAALGLPAERPSRPNLAAAATQLNVSETALRDALRSQMRAAMAQRRAGQGNSAGPGAALAAAATQLNVSETALRDALGIPEAMVRPDLAAAAAQLGVSETDLQTALRNAMGDRRSNPRP